ncbi:AMP-binding protein [Microcoleus sp. B3-A4]|uniref:AMP-binding protein n=1 Tax=Microcoleus sp. B3-A4 TaxID=2818653 RepID=UPI002FCE6D47
MIPPKATPSMGLNHQGFNNISTLVDLLRQKAVKNPNQQGYTFLEDGKIESESLTYKKLDQRARAIAAHLQSLNTQGQRALLLYPAGLDFLCAFFGCLYAGVIAIPAPPPEASRLKRTLPRLQAIAKDARATITLTTLGIMSLVEEYRQQVPEFQQMQWLDSQAITLELAEQWQPPAIESDTLAYLQYTSGSTSSPRGVMISHKNVIHHCNNLQKSCGYTPDSVTVTWMPYFHDYGLIEGLLEPLYNGTPCYVMSPVAFIKRPFRWLEAISRYKATHSQAPNFAYDLCVRRINSQQWEQLDLSCWRAAGNAAEPINPEVLTKFTETLNPCGFSPKAFCPAYGLAEATLLVSSSPENETFISTKFLASELEKSHIVPANSDSADLVRTIASCGRLIRDVKVAIVNPYTLKRCTADEVGEVWVSDPSVAQGYWQRPDATEETFLAYIQDTREGPFLRTGDLGFLYQEQLYITGRIKDVIIIRGTNHYPQDLEWTVQKTHCSLRPENGAAFSIEVNGEERLVIAQEIERGYRETLDIDEVIIKIRQAIFEHHELELYAVVLLKRGTLFKTASGKIQRSSCRASFLNNTLEIVGGWTANQVSAKQQNFNQQVEEQLIAPRDQRELQLVNICQKVFGTAPISVTDNFFELGVNSLLIVCLFTEIEREFGKKLPLSTIFETPRIEQLAHRLQQLDEETPWNSLILLNPGQPYKPPLFLIHDADGEIILYQNLARRLAGNRPVYGLRPYGKSGYPVLHTRFKDMAAHYIEEIRKIQPTGPYLLGGLCAGGNLAFEMAVQLQHQGEKSSTVILIESWDVKNPLNLNISNQRLQSFSKLITESQNLKKLERLGYIFNKAQRKVRNLISYLVKKRREEVQNYLKINLYRYCLDKKLSLPQFLQNITVRSLLIFDAQHYVPELYQGQVVLFRASEVIITDNPSIDDVPAIQLSSNPLMGWDKRVTKKIEVYDLPGGHSSCLQEPYVQVLAEKLEACIAEAILKEKK